MRRITLLPKIAHEELDISNRYKHILTDHEGKFSICWGQINEMDDAKQISQYNI